MNFRWPHKLWTKCLVIFLLLICIPAAFLIFNYKSILRKAENYLIVSESPKKTDVVVVLSGNDMEERVNLGARLINEGFSDIMILSGGPAYWNTTVSETMKKQAIFLRVPEESIILETKSTTTDDNAKFCLEIIKEKGFGSVTVVTSPYHTRRAQDFFLRYIAGHDIELMMCSFELDKKEYWWKDPGAAQFVANEYLKMIWDSFFGEK